MTPTPFGDLALEAVTGEILATLRRIEKLLTPAAGTPKADHKHTYTMGGEGCIICGAPEPT